VVLAVVQVAEWVAVRAEVRAAQAGAVDQVVVRAAVRVVYLQDLDGDGISNVLTVVPAADQVRAVAQAQVEEVQDVVLVVAPVEVQAREERVQDVVQVLEVQNVILVVPVIIRGV
jgi:hypothetical protein